MMMDNRVTFNAMVLMSTLCKFWLNKLDSKYATRWRYYIEMYLKIKSITCKYFFNDFGFLHYSKWSELDAKVQCDQWNSFNDTLLIPIQYGFGDMNHWCKVYSIDRVNSTILHHRFSKLG